MKNKYLSTCIHNCLEKMNFTWTVLKEEDRWFGWFLLCSAAMVKKSLRIWWWHPNSMKLHGWPQKNWIVRHTILGTKISAPRGQPSLSGSVGRGMRWLFSDIVLHQVLSSDNIRFSTKRASIFMNDFFSSKKVYAKAYHVVTISDMEKIKTSSSTWSFLTFH